MRLVVLASVALLAACGGTARPVAIAPELPSTSFGPYPHFPSASCWTRAISGRPLRDAPSRAVAPTHRTPSAIAAALLARFGDRRYVRRIAFAPVPPITRQHTGYFPNEKPPADALWAYVSGLRPKTGVAAQLAEWEGGLAAGALRDELCAAGGAPLVGWTVDGERGLSNSSDALEQHFPEPTPMQFLRRLALVGKRYHFSVASVTFLRPLQVAPIVVVRTSRPRTAFVKDVVPIMQLLDPRNGQAVTFEGFFFEATDGKGPFATVFDVYRGEVMGGDWAWSPCDYPYPSSGMPGRHC